MRPRVRPIALAAALALGRAAPAIIAVLFLVAFVPETALLIPPLGGFVK